MLGPLEEALVGPRLTALTAGRRRQEETVSKVPRAKENKNICEPHAWAFGSVNSGLLLVCLLCIGTKILTFVLTSKLKDCFLLSPF